MNKKIVVLFYILILYGQIPLLSVYKNTEYKITNISIQNSEESLQLPLSNGEVLLYEIINEDGINYARLVLDRIEDAYHPPLNISNPSPEERHETYKVIFKIFKWDENKIKWILLDGINGEMYGGTFNKSNFILMNHENNMQPMYPFVLPLNKPNILEDSLIYYNNTLFIYNSKIDNKYNLTGGSSNIILEYIDNILNSVVIIENQNITLEITRLLSTTLLPRNTIPNGIIKIININDKNVTVAYESINTAEQYTLFWDFGDQYNTTTSIPSHTYEKYGKYTITLTVTDQSFDVKNFTLDIELKNSIVIPIIGSIIGGILTAVGIFLIYRKFIRPKPFYKNNVLTCKTGFILDSDKNICKRMPKIKST